MAGMTKTVTRVLGQVGLPTLREKALETVVRTNPLSRARSVRRATQMMAEDEKIPPKT